MPIFTSQGLLNDIPCPAGNDCEVINCWYEHTAKFRPRPNPDLFAGAIIETGNLDEGFPDGHTVKRRKLDHGSQVRSVASEERQDTLNKLSAELATTNIRSMNTASDVKAPSQVAIKPAQPVERREPSAGNGTSVKPSAAKPAPPTEPPTKKPLQTLRKEVSPPPQSRQIKPPPPFTAVKTGIVAKAKPEVKESLNPRMIPNDPAGHAKRTLYLRHMHEQMKLKNDEVNKSNLAVAAEEALLLSDQELIKLALDEEEKLARENANVYANIIKLRIVAYKKMSLTDWKTHILSTVTRANKEPSPPPLKKEVEPLDTGLPLEQEHHILSRLITDQSLLVKHGYIPTPPTPEEIAEAEAAVAASLNHEVCDRCRSRFRVYPDRREEDGAITTNGPCIYHWGRPFTPRREKTDAIKGPKETTYTCCGDLLGTKGCSEQASHVFKTSSPARLASVLPFITTPGNPTPEKGPDGKEVKAVTFDCEMGYTSLGLELIRLTAVSWPQGSALIDVLVRPLGTILDLNSRFSGVWPDAFTSAIPYDDNASLPPSSTDPDATAPSPLQIVSTPQKARELLLRYLTPSTPLIGHALENDLNSIRLCHPTIIDTIVLFPHPRGLPMRFGLKMLTKKYLNWDIQTGGDRGHDSLEDARATGMLVRWKVGREWRMLQGQGWRVGGEGLMPPLPDGGPPAPEAGGAQQSEAEARVLGGGEGRVIGVGGGVGGVKRQRIQIGADVVKKQRSI